ncbi:MAG: hypothetical protein DLD55_00370 [candidate division SR1 bacterium]|nr:MAG: hypothetical protein DLD55_00370 [candidate division SR1 bacterium]
MLEKNSGPEISQNAGSLGKKTEDLLQILKPMHLHSKDRALFNEKKEAIKGTKNENCYVIADFDRTLTYGTFNGQKTPSIISLLRDGKHLTEDYAEKAHALFDHYHAIECDPKLSLEYKKAQMQERWEKHDQLLIASQLQLKDLKDIATNGHLQLRKGVQESLKKLDEAGIPLVIFSASGCGDAIPLFMQHNNCDFPNISYVINRFSRDKSGFAQGIEGEIIHALNKDEGVFSKLPELKTKLANKQHVIVIGDGLGDAQMAQANTHKTTLKIGILTIDNPELLKTYEDSFDLVLIGDGDFDQIKNLFDELF